VSEGWEMFDEWEKDRCSFPERLCVQEIRDMNCLDVHFGKRVEKLSMVWIDRLVNHHEGWNLWGTWRDLGKVIHKKVIVFFSN
jgi:hypothetical protein